MAVWTLLRLAAGRWIAAVPVLIVLGLAASVADGLGVSMLVLLLKLMLGGGDDAAATGGLFQGIYQLVTGVFGRNVVVIAVVTVGLVITKVLLIAGYNMLSSAMNARVNHRLRRLIFARFLEDDYALHSERSSGHCLNLVTSESVQATEAFWCAFAMGVDLCAMLVFGAMLMLIAWPLVLVVAGGQLVASLVNRHLALRAQRSGSALTQAHSAHASRTASVLGGMRMIRAFGRERDESARFETGSERIRAAFQRVQFMKAATAPVAEGLYLVVFVGIVAMASWLHTPLASVITFVVILARLQPHVKDFDWCRVQLAGHTATVENLLAFLRQAPHAAPVETKPPFPGLQERIRFEDVSFRYPSTTEPSLSGISFDIPKGKTTAIVGGSGAGKSTITNLLLRLYEPSEGRLTVDGAPLAGFDAGSWRRHLAIAGQDADLIGGTILENVRYGCPSADIPEVMRALEDAGILDFVQALPTGLETRVGERGLRLSGGQRQRLSLARALLRKADLLILDEATNALDAVLENEIQAAIARAAASTTLVVIAHRLSTVAAADHVVVLRHGRIVEQGRPQQLLKSGDGHFRELYLAHDSASRRIVGHDDDAGSAVVPIDALRRT